VNFIVFLELGDDEGNHGCQQEHADEIVFELFFDFLPYAFFLFPLKLVGAELGKPLGCFFRGQTLG
jgi:hypothetical protein